MRRTDPKNPAGLVPLLAAVAALLPLTACAPPAPGALVKPALGVHYSSGDPKGLVDEQVGLQDAHRTRGTIDTGGLGYEGPVHVACGPLAESSTPTFRLRLTAEDPALLDLTLVLRDFERYGTYEAEVRLERIGPQGTFLRSTGRGTVEIASAVHRAGRHGASGSFTAEVEGGAGSGELEGSFESCYFFD